MSSGTPPSPSPGALTRNKQRPPRLAVLIANPLAYRGADGRLAALPQVNARRERDKLFASLREGCEETGKSIEVRCRTATTDNLRSEVTLGCRAIHYVGHGSPRFLSFEDGRGGVHAVSVQVLQALFKAGQQERVSDVEIVVVSACYSRAAGEAFVAAGVRHVVCVETDAAVQDMAAVCFTRAFYLALLAGKTVKQSFDIAKVAVLSSPELTMGGQGADESEKFRLLPESARDGDFEGRHDKQIFRDAARNSSGGPGHLINTTPQRTTHNLPSKPDCFLGRTLEVYATLTQVLHHRLVTVTAGFGFGKTAVAIVAAHFFSERRMFRDGIVFVRFRNHWTSAAGRRERLSRTGGSGRLIAGTPAPATAAAALGHVTPSGAGRRGRGSPDHLMSSQLGQGAAEEAEAAEREREHERLATQMWSDLASAINAVMPMPAPTSPATPTHRRRVSTGSVVATTSSTTSMHFTSSTPPDAALGFQAHAQSSHQFQRQAKAALLERIKHKHMLLLLDNSARALDDHPALLQGFVAGLLEATTSVKIIVTSSKCVGRCTATTERVLELPPLSDTDAVRLFVSRCPGTTQLTNPTTPVARMRTSSSTSSINSSTSTSTSADGSQGSGSGSGSRSENAFDPAVVAKRKGLMKRLGGNPHAISLAASVMQYPGRTLDDLEALLEGTKQCPADDEQSRDMVMEINRVIKTGHQFLDTSVEFTGEHSMMNQRLRTGSADTDDLTLPEAGEYTHSAPASLATFSAATAVSAKVVTAPPTLRRQRSDRAAAAAAAGILLPVAASTAIVARPSSPNERSSSSSSGGGVSIVPYDQAAPPLGMAMPPQYGYVGGGHGAPGMDEAGEMMPPTDSQASDVLLVRPLSTSPQPQAQPLEMMPGVRMGLRHPQRRPSDLDGWERRSRRPDNKNPDRPSLSLYIGAGVAIAAASATLGWSRGRTTAEQQRRRVRVVRERSSSRRRKTTSRWSRQQEEGGEGEEEEADEEEEEPLGLRSRL